MCSRVVFVIVILSVFSIILADPELDKMVLKIYKNRNNQLLCDKTIDNIKYNQITAKEGEPLKIEIKFRKYIDYIQCTDYTNSSLIFVNKSRLPPKNHIFEVPKVTKAMNATWNCRILALRNIQGLPTVSYKGAKFASFNCMVQVNVLPADLFDLQNDEMPAEPDICQDEKDEIATLRVQNAIFTNLLKDCCQTVKGDLITCSADCFEKEPERFRYKYEYPSYN